MLESGQHWELFGYDMRQLGKHWFAAWRSFLWSGESPLRQRLDEVVCLHHPVGSTLFQAGEVIAEAPFDCQAMLLPDDLVLARPLSLPRVVESDINDALVLEVNANSPFSSADTACGFRVVSRDETQLHLVLVIVSKSAVMAWLGKEHDIHEPGVREIWADVGGAKVTVTGFGEAARESRYRRRLFRCGAFVALSAMLVLGIAAVATGTKRVELARMEALASSTQQAAGEATALRSTVALASERIRAANVLVASHPSPHYEIARLTRLLGDGAHVLQFTLNGREMRLRGRAEDASSVMQILTKEAAYAAVTAPQAIIKVANSGLEQFSLNVTLAGGDSE